MDTLAYIRDKYNLDYNNRSPLYIPLKREGLAKLFAELGYTKGAEIGVERGLYSQILAESIPNLRLYSIDAWEAYQGYRDHVSQARLNDFHAEAVKRLAPYDCRVVRQYSDAAAAMFENGELDFVYIDGNHEFYQVTQDIYKWLPKIRSGGIISGHDFKRDSGRDWVCHVKDVVQAWAYSHKVHPWFVLTGNGNPNWMWVIP